MTLHSVAGSLKEFDFLCGLSECISFLDISKIFAHYVCADGYVWIRSKMASSKETGVAAGFGVIDSPYLYD